LTSNNLSNRAANLVRFSFGRTRLNFLEQKNSSPFIFHDDPSILKYGFTGPIGQLLIAPFSPIGVDVFNFNQRRADNTFQVGDTLSYQVGRHNLKAGLDIRRSQLNSLLDRNFRPLVTFVGGRPGPDAIPVNINLPGVGNFSARFLHGLDLAALGVPSGILQTLSLSPNSTLGLRSTAYHFFFTDNWRVHSKVTIDWGLRYELNTVPTEADNRITRALLAPDLPPPDPSFDIQPEFLAAFDQTLATYMDFLGRRTNLYDSDWRGLAPRFGVAWRLNDKTVLRGGYGIFYDQIIGSVTSQSRNIFPNMLPINFSARTDVALNGQIFDNPFYLNFQTNAGMCRRPCHLVVQDRGPSNQLAIPSGLVRAVLGYFLISGQGGIAFTLPARHLRTPYAQHYNLIYERELFDNTALSIGYVGSRGMRLTRFRTPNGGINNTAEFRDGVLTGVAAPITRHTFPNLGAFTIFEDNASSSFNSLQLSAQRWFGSGLQFIASYTYSHAFDDVSDVFDGVGFFALPQNSDNLPAEKASASFDVRHRLAIGYLWELPVFRENNILGRWKLTGINTFQTGQPFTVNTGIDVNRTGNLTNRLDSTAGLVVRDGGPNRIEGTPDFLIYRNELDKFLAQSGKDGRIRRNTFRAAGIATVDLAIMKSFKLTESRSIEFRSELFNCFNRTHFGIPVRILESPGFGHSVNTLLRPRHIQFALKFKF
jgi:hypothetical protein